MKELAIIKIGLRTQFRFTKGNDAEHPEQRHWLAYPVTKHSVRSWGNNTRLPNALRFKIRPDSHDPKKLRGIIFHMPCMPPESFKAEMQDIEQVWKQVYSFLAQKQNLMRVQE